MFKPLRALLFAGLVALAASGSTHGGQYPALYRDAAGSAPADGRLSVMTYNVKGLPWPIAFGREEALDDIADRLAQLRRSGQQPHIILLQEAFTAQAARIALRAGYAHVAHGPDAASLSGIAMDVADRPFLAKARWERGEAVGKQLGSGLQILSDYPIKRIDRITFPDFACAGFDCLANKGVLIAHLAVPGFDGPISIVNTHLNARGAAGVSIERTQRAFVRQVDLMTRFVASHVPAGQAMVLGGDMNIGKDGRRADAFFTSFAQAGMRFIRPDLGGARRALVQSACIDAATCRDLGLASGKAKDWLFARNGQDRPLPVLSAHVPFGYEPDGASLSDHFGYVIDYGLGPPIRVATGGPAGARL
ncbi:endonuclease/exonuclease/phosphatase family protein [Sphingobium sp.]|uniref:endonuclease/exonuclease/phosphatase family protein n=1 Tax=Sphingobium sp. TaxID=1912891 RepID=UPI003BB55208